METEIDNFNLFDEIAAPTLEPMPIITPPPSVQQGVPILTRSKKCTKCEVTKDISEFVGVNGKETKTCSKCRGKKSAPSEPVKILPPAPIIQEVPVIPPPALPAEDLQIPSQPICKIIESIWSAEDVLKKDRTSIEKLNVMSIEERQKYLAFLVESISGKMEKAMGNPLTNVVLVGCRTIETAVVPIAAKTAGVDISLDGWTKSLADERKILDEICTDVMQEHPEFAKLLTPTMRLLLLLGSTAADRAAINSYNKQMGFSIGNSRN